MALCLQIFCIFALEEVVFPNYEDIYKQTDT